MNRERKKVINIAIFIIGIALLSFIILAHQIKGIRRAINNDSLTFPIRGMFYYPWFPETWTQQEIRPFTHYHPTLGYYSSSDSAVIAQHIQAMQYGGIQVGIAEWDGQRTSLDQRVPVLLNAAAGTGFRWNFGAPGRHARPGRVAQTRTRLAR